MPVLPVFGRRVGLAAVPVVLLLTAAVGLGQQPYVPPAAPPAFDPRRPAGANAGTPAYEPWELDECRTCGHKFPISLRAENCPKCKAALASGNTSNSDDDPPTRVRARSARSIIWLVVLGVSVLAAVVRYGIKFAVAAGSPKESRPKKRAKPRRPPPPEYFDDEEDDAPPRRSARASDDVDDRPAPKRARAVPDDGDSGFEVVDAPPPQLARRATRPAAAPAPPRPSAPAADSPFEVVDDDAPRRPRPRRD